MARSKSKLHAQISSPTGDRRHTAKVRDGKMSGEVFCKNEKRRIELGLPIFRYSDDDYVEDLRR